MRSPVQLPPDRTAPGDGAIGLAIVRVVVGAIFVAHGAQKVFSLGIGGTIALLTRLGIPLPTIAGPVVAAVELGCGILLVLGLLTRLGALGLALDMIGAMLFVNMKGGFFSPPGVEYPLALLAACVALVLSGSGRWAIDRALARRKRPGPN